MQVKINSYITTSNLTEEQAIEQATSMVDAYDTINENRLGEVVTKLYYIVPTLGKILVVVNEADRDILGVESNILANTNISDYPLERLPANVIDYKELIVKVGSTLTTEQIFNAGQSIVEETASKSMPYKIPVLKVINYNNTDVDSLVMPSIFGSNIFSSIGGIVNGGDADAGEDTLQFTRTMLGNYIINNNERNAPDLSDADFIEFQLITDGTIYGSKRDEKGTRRVLADKETEDDYHVISGIVIHKWEDSIYIVSSSGGNASAIGDDGDTTGWYQTGVDNYYNFNHKIKMENKDGNALIYIDDILVNTANDSQFAFNIDWFLGSTIDGRNVTGVQINDFTIGKLR